MPRARPSAPTLQALGARGQQRGGPRTQSGTGGPPRWATARGIAVPKRRKQASNSRAQGRVTAPGWGRQGARSGMGRQIWGNTATQS